MADFVNARMLSKIITNNVDAILASNIRTKL